MLRPSIALFLFLMNFALPSLTFAKEEPADESDCLAMLLDDSKLREIWKQLQFNKSSGTDFILFKRENAYNHWRAFRLLVEAEEKEAARAGKTAKPIDEDPTKLAFWVRKNLWGLVLGDPHLRNLENRLFPGHYGFRESVRIVFNDFDDAGFGPLFGDILRLGSLSHAEGLKIGRLPEFYLEGLVGHKIDEPKVLRPFLDLSPREFFDLQTELFDSELRKIEKALTSTKPRKDTLEGHPDAIAYNYNAGAGYLEPLVDPQLIARLQSLVGLELVKLNGLSHNAFLYTKSGGGSGGNPRDPIVSRYWLLVKNPYGMPEIMEFKRPTVRPGVAGFHPNQDRSPGGRYQMTIARAYGALSVPRLVPVFGQDYLMRDKLVNPLKKAIQDEMGADEKTDVARFAGHLLGEFHGRAPESDRSAHDLAKLIHKHRAAFKALFKTTVLQIDRIMHMGFDSTDAGTWQPVEE